MHFMYKKHGSARKTAAPAIFLLAAVLLCFLVGAGFRGGNAGAKHTRCRTCGESDMG